MSADVAKQFPRESLRGVSASSEVIDLGNVEVLKNAQFKMPRTILFSQCLLGDFIRPLGPRENVPNLVHVGAQEAARLMGPHGLMPSFLECAHKLPSDDVVVIHIGDEHDKEKDKAHLKIFGVHGIANTEGAALVQPIPDFLPSGKAARPNTYFVRGGLLDDLEGSPLPILLKELLEGRDLSSVRIGIVGVWTNVKVAILAQNLIQRLGAKEVAICSALTASSDIGKHFQALEDLESYHGVKVHHSAGEFLKWLNGGQPLIETPMIAHATGLTFDGEVVGNQWSAEREDERNRLITSLSKSPRSLTLKPLGGGYSGSQVFRAISSDGDLSVIKIGTRDEIAKERFCNERVGHILRRLVPNLRAYSEGETLAAMEMELATTIHPEVKGPTTFQWIAQNAFGAHYDDILVDVLWRSVHDGLGRFYQVAEKANADLFRTFTFNDNYGRPSSGPSVSRHSEAIATANHFESSKQAAQSLLPDNQWLDPVEFYNSWLPGKSCVREVYNATSHGDLNLQNILFSFRPGAMSAEKTWVIDFARMCRLPVLTDLAKIENDLSYIMLPIDSDAALRRAVTLQDLRLSSATLNDVNLMGAAETPAEKRYARLVEELRNIAVQLDSRGPEAMDQYRVALMRYAGHTLSFSEPNARQRMLALLGCARIGFQVKKYVETPAI